MRIAPARARQRVLTPWLVLLLSVAAGSPHAYAASSDTYEITFAQLTDAHVFDDGWQQPVFDALRQAANDRSALDWAIDQINRTVIAGTKIDFVAYTGDLGLQNVDFAGDAGCHALPVKVEPGQPPVTWTAAVTEVALELDRLQVRTVFFVTGNNDILNEDVTDPRFDCFLEALQKQVRFLPKPLRVEALRPDRSVEINGIHLAGLDSASFKKRRNYDAACAKAAAGAELARGCPLPQMESLGKLVARDPAPPLVLFTHVPDLIDPYYHRMHPDVRQSAWEIPDDVRSLWERDVCRPGVVGVFAGHFHDASPAVYGSNVSTRDLAYTSCVAQKTWVAPPLALKNQERMLAKARGFLLVHIAEGKVAEIRVKWFEGPSAAFPEN